MLSRPFEFIFVFIPITLIGYFSILRICSHWTAQLAEFREGLRQPKSNPPAASRATLSEALEPIRG
jgi:hypothetical protein